MDGFTGVLPPPLEAGPSEDQIAFARSSADEFARTFSSTPLPDDVRPTHLWEVEFQAVMSRTRAS